MILFQPTRTEQGVLSAHQHDESSLTSEENEEMTFLNIWSELESNLDEIEVPIEIDEGLDVLPSDGIPPVIDSETSDTENFNLPQWLGSEGSASQEGSAPIEVSEPATPLNGGNLVELVEIEDSRPIALGSTMTAAIEGELMLPHVSQDAFSQLDKPSFPAVNRTESQSGELLYPTVEITESGSQLKPVVTTEMVATNKNEQVKHSAEPVPTSGIALQIPSEHHVEATPSSLTARQTSTEQGLQSALPNLIATPTSSEQGPHAVPSSLDTPQTFAEEPVGERLNVVPSISAATTSKASSGKFEADDILPQNEHPKTSNLPFNGAASSNVAHAPQFMQNSPDALTSVLAESHEFPSTSALDNETGLSQPLSSPAPSTTITQVIKPTTPSVVQQMATALTQSSGQSTQIALNPEELGRVRISLSTNEVGMVVSIIAERPETADLMRRNIDSLLKDFSDLGFDNPTFDFQEKGEREENSSSGEPSNSFDDLSDDSQPAAPTSLTARNIMQGGLDLKL